MLELPQAESLVAAYLGTIVVIDLTTNDTKLRLLFRVLCASLGIKNSFLTVLTVISTSH